MTSDGLELVELLRRGERALLVEGCLRSSRQWFETAYREAESAGRVSEMARAALGLGGWWVHEHRTAAEAAEVEARQRRVLACLDPGSVLGLRLRARLVGESAAAVIFLWIGAPSEEVDEGPGARPLITPLSFSTT